MTETVDGVTQLPPDQCPVCDETIRAAGSTRGANIAPRAGDLTICTYCLHWLVYTQPSADGPLRMRALTAEEWATLPEAERTELDGIRQRADVAWRTADGRQRAQQRTRPQ